MLSPEQPVSTFPGIGPQTLSRLQKLNINTIGDLLKHYPSRFLDFSQATPIKLLKEKVPASFIATINQPKQFRTRSGKIITQATATDTSGQITLTWFNSPYIKTLIKPGRSYYLAGKPSYFGPKITLVAPQIELVGGKPLHTQGLVPIYPQTDKLTSKTLRRLINRIISLVKIDDPLPSDILQAESLLPLIKAFQQIHFPRNPQEHLEADRRLSFDQHLQINLKNQIENQSHGQAPQIKANLKIHQELLKKIPFTLTPDQNKTLRRLYHSFALPAPSHILVQGDTGSGKTVLALFSALQTVNHNLSFSLLAPTQILAEQHYYTFKKLLPAKLAINLITAKSHYQANSSKPQIFIGTHALLSQLPTTLKYPLGCVFIDEQHKFGVKQRDWLKNRSPNPHLVNLTATPIPRTLALGIFGDIDTLTIRHKPQSRPPAKTWIISNNRFSKSSSWLSDKLKTSNKIFVVCPFIEQSSSLKTVQAAKNLYLKYQKSFASIAPVYLIHGRLSPEEKAEILNKFTLAPNGILVSTPIIEVGIDIPTANIIIIHSAERFGLAQLHQLRGRVGRGSDPSFCLLIPSTDDLQNIKRLELLTRYHSGLALAKLDLKLRGSGQIAGLKQHGHYSTRLQYFWDKKSFQKAKKYALRLVKKSPANAGVIAIRLSSW